MIRAIRLFFVLFILTQLGLACSAKDQARQTPKVPPTRSLPSPSPTLTPTPPLLPPILVESKPQAGGELGLRDPVTFYFDQPMQRQSVEKALSWKSSRGGVVQGKLEWQDDATLQFLPVSPLEPASELTFSITAAARSIKGINFPQPVEVRYRTAGFVHLTQALPEPGASGVNPTAAVVAAFDQPLVPLGSEGKDLPDAFWRPTCPWPRRVVEHFHVHLLPGTLPRRRPYLQRLYESRAAQRLWQPFTDFGSGRTAG